MASVAKVSGFWFCLGLVNSLWVAGCNVDRGISLRSPISEYNGSILKDAGLARLISQDLD